MTVTVRELIGSRPVDFQGGQRTSVRMFSVEQDSPPLSSSVEVEALFGSNGLPQRGDTLPGSTLQAFEYRIRPFDGQTDLFEVIWQYRDAGGGYVGVEKQPGEVGYVEISATIAGEYQDNWRYLSKAHFSGLVASGGTYPNGSDAGEFDIGGTSVDASGEPVSTLRRNVRLSVGVTTDVFPTVEQYFPFVGRRNNTTFWGAPAGSIVYVGTSINRSDVRRWNVQHEFVLDEFYHLLQQAARNPRGEVVLDAETGQAKNVWFKQPFPDFGNFYAIDPNFAGKL